jgi:hypothetical protein
LKDATDLEIWKLPVALQKISIQVKSFSFSFEQLTDANDAVSVIEVFRAQISGIW